MTSKLSLSRWTTGDIARLRDRLSYDPETGIFTRLPISGGHFAKSWNARYAGKPAFSRCRVKGYLRGAFEGKTLYAHRLAFAFMVGRWPVGEIDHINRDTGDNRWCNLRECSRGENARNMVGRSKSGFKGVYPIGNRWYARIKRGGCLIHLGCYAIAEDAARAYDIAAIQHDGEFVRTNLPMTAGVAA